MNRTLYIKKGFSLDTETGRQEIMQQYGSTCYIVHNFDENDMYTGASYLTDHDIMRKYFDMTGNVYTSVVMESEPEEIEPDTNAIRNAARTWIENADISPVPEIDTETARQYLSWMDPETLPEGINPENFAAAWNDIVRTCSVPKTETDNDYQQYIADIYHCSETWGQKMTEEEMYISLVEWEKEKCPGDYSPSPYLFRQCCEYWNHLCDIYPS